MNSLSTRIARVLLACAVLTASGLPAWARIWNPTAKSLAQDYGMIQDNRSDKQIVMLFWIPPQMADSKDMQDVLTANLLLGVMDGTMTPDGKMSFSSTDALLAKDAQGNTIRILKDNEVPPAVAGGVQAMESFFRQALGPMGAGFRWFVLDGSNVHSCKAGSGFSVQFAGETYTYDTPIPGCPKT
jgi:hypothetical protein